MWRKQDDLQTMLLRSLEAYVAADYPIARVRASRSVDCGFDLDAWREMAALGWTGMLLAEDLGGAALGIGSALSLASGFGRSLLPEPLVAVAVIAATVLDRSDSETARELAAGVAAGNGLVTLAWQERVNQISFEPQSTFLHQNAGRLSLDGKKVFVPAWAPGTRVIVSASHGQGKALVLAHPSDVRSRRMADGTLTADLEFRDVAVAPGDILLSGPAADSVLELSLIRGLIAVCAQMEGLAAAALSATIDYMNKRVQFGQSLAEFQALRHRIVDLHTEIELSGASWRLAADRLEEGAPAARVSASAAKARCSQTAIEVTKTALQFHGAFGYTDEADVGLYLNSALRLSSWLGNPLPHRRHAFDLRAGAQEHA